MTSLKQARGWVKFISILGFVMMGLMISAGIIISIVSSSTVAFSEAGFPGIIIALIYIVIAGVYLIPLIYLFKFTKAAENTYIHNDPSGLDGAVKNLKNHFKSIGIIIIGFLSVYILVIIIAAIAGMANLF